MNSADLVEYEIRDLTPDRFDEAFHLMSTDYLHNEPMNQYGECWKETGVIERFREMCWAVLQQKTPIACFKKSTDEIVAANMVAVYSQIDNLGEQFENFVSQQIF